MLYSGYPQVNTEGNKKTTHSEYRRKQKIDPAHWETPDTTVMIHVVLPLVNEQRVPVYRAVKRCLGHNPVTKVALVIAGTRDALQSQLRLREHDTNFAHFYWPQKGSAVLGTLALY